MEDNENNGHIPWEISAEQISEASGSNSFLGFRGFPCLLAKDNMVVLLSSCRATCREVAFSSQPFK